MTPKQLKQIGVKLGAGWQTKLSRLMPCSDRTVRRWVSGESNISDMIAERIKQVVDVAIREEG